MNGRACSRQPIALVPCACATRRFADCGALSKTGEEPMVDRASRHRLAELLRQLVAGRITNDEFEDRVPRDSPDPGIEAVLGDGAWFLYLKRS